METAKEQKWGTQSLYIASNLNDIFVPVGRTYTENKALACDFTCTGIRFSAECEGDVSVYITSTAKAYFTLYINGERTDDRIAVAKGSSWVTVAKELPRSVYEFELVKQSQYTMATVSLKEVRLTGIFRAAQSRKLFIEFYGDSILNGSNIYLGGTSVETSDGTRAFGWLTAKALNADCNIIGCGGLGLSVSGMDWIMDDVWNLAGSNLKTSTPVYDFGRVPDFVVIELGDNDAARASQTTIRKYKIQVKNFVEKIREKYGDSVPIVWLYGYHPETYWEHTKYVLDLLGGKEANLYYCRLTESYISKDNGGDGNHPNVQTSEVMAEELTSYLKNLLKKQ